MKHPIVVGLQYGDEGKGKITDTLASQADWVIRFNGGNNAGHTLWLNGKKIVTHSVPSGVRYEHAKNFIGAGCVLNAEALQIELKEIADAGSPLTADRLKVDYRTHLILPIHVALDVARENTSKGIGTTKRGIGPTYTSKTDRTGIRAGDLFNADIKERVSFLCKTWNAVLKASGLPESSEQENLLAIEKAVSVLRPYLSTEVVPFFEVAKKQKCVLEGAQGVLLDLDHGTYPFVTSSTTLPAYAAAGAPFPMTKLGAVVGVAKAYLTRVGRGPFNTELLDDTGERIRKNGQEFGATTGRPRRIGWLDADELKQAVQLADCTHIVLTKADVLNGEARVGLWMNGKLSYFDGWKDAKDSNFEKYVSAVESHVGSPICAVGTGADRADLLWRHPVKDFWKL